MPSASDFDLNANPLPDLPDLLWAVLLLIGVPYLVLLPLMFLIWLLEIRSTHQLFQSLTQRGVAGFLRWNRRKAVRLTILAALQAAVVAAVYCCAAWMRLFFLDVSARPDLDELLAAAFGDPVGRNIASIAAYLTAGFAIAYSLARASHHEFAIRVMTLPCAAVVICGGILGLGASVLFGFGWLAYGRPFDIYTCAFLGVAVTGIVIWFAGCTVAEQATLAFPKPVEHWEAHERAF